MHSCDGSMLAVASSYTFEEGEKQQRSGTMEEDNIHIKRINDSDVKPKKKATAAV